MGTTDNSLWIKIQQGLRETEALMNQKQYNMVMIKSRQTLEYMIHFLAEKALIVETDLADSIDQLYEGRFISQAVKDHYHRIRVLGNKAVHEGNDSPYDASEACKLLTAEVTAFTNAFHRSHQDRQSQRPHTAGVQAAPIASRASTQRTAAAADEPRRTGTPQRAVSGSSHRNGSRSAQRPAQGSGTRNSRRPAPQNRSRRRNKKKNSDLSGLLKPLLIFLLLFVIVLIIVKLIPGKDKKNETLPTESSTEITSEAVSTTAEVTTEPTETETEPPKIYTTKSKLNVRSKPASDSTKLGSLASGTVVEYVDTYDDKWTVIMFEGKQAYVATEFLTITEGTGESESESASESTKAAGQ